MWVFYVSIPIVALLMLAILLAPSPYHDAENNYCATHDLATMSFTDWRMCKGDEAK